MGKYLDYKVRVEEVWGMQFPDGRVLSQGYSQRTLTSLEDCKSDFPEGVGTPILLERRTIEKLVEWDN